MRLVAPLLLATVCFSFCVKTYPSVIRYQSSAKPSETAKKLYEMIGRGDIEETEKLIIFPPAATNLAIEQFKMSMEGVTQAQIMYSVTKSGGKFADLETLGKEGLIDSELASGEKQGYLFTSKPILVKNRPAMFDTTAKPKHPGFGGMWNRSFYCNETAVIYEAYGGKPPSATVSNRVPKNGSAVDR